MRVVVCELYAEAGVSFPFPDSIQRHLEAALSELATPGPQFCRKYGADFSLAVYLGASTQTAGVEVNGPAVYRKAKRVEYAVDLPYDLIVPADDWCRAAMGFLLDGIREVFFRADIEGRLPHARWQSLVEAVCSERESASPEAMAAFYHRNQEKYGKALADLLELHPRLEYSPIAKRYYMMRQEQSETPGSDCQCDPAIKRD